MHDICLMKLVITSATPQEIELVKNEMKTLFDKKAPGFSISFHTSGVGILSSCYSIAQLIFSEKPGLIVQAGIAGSFNKKTPLGSVVAIKNDFLADTGVEENGSFRDLFDLNLQAANSFPFTNKALPNKWLEQFNHLQLDEVTGVTVNEITTRAQRMEQLKAKYNPETESMEGASLHYCCLQTSTPFIQIRAISNYVGERDKTKWKFKEAFENLSGAVLNYVRNLNDIL